MPNWSAVTEVAKESQVFSRLMLVIFGVYLWELFITLPFEWSLVTGKRQFKWPLSMCFFFLCRYSILWALIGLIISLNIQSELNCEALYTFNSVCGNVAIATASTCLMLRTVALWERRLKLVIPLGILWIGYWVIMIYGMFIVHAAWDPTTESCAVVKTNHVMLNVAFFSTMGFDFIVLFLTTTALLKQINRSTLWNLLFRDGLVYFLVTFTCNCVPAVLNVLDLNTVMNVIATVPAATVSSVAACRAVMRLSSYRQEDTYLHTSSYIAGANGDVRLTRYGPTIKSKTFTPTRPQVRVTTDQIVIDEIPPTSAGYSAGSSTAYDGRSPLKKSEVDLETGASAFEVRYTKEESTEDDRNSTHAL